MATATKQDAKLDRAYVQSKVIETNLQHLKATLSDVDPQLREDVRWYADRFEQYVRKLGHACERAPGES